MGLFTLLPVSRNIPTTNYKQVISPFGLITAYFSMDKAVIPFALTMRSFFIAYFLIMFIISLAFVIFKTSPQWAPSAWARVSVWFAVNRRNETTTLQPPQEPMSTLSKTDSMATTTVEGDEIELSSLHGVTIGRNDLSVV
jgi:hypothetical protein